MARLRYSLLVLVAALVGSATVAQGITIGFELDPDGLKPNGWSSADSALVQFTDSIGADMRVQDWAHQSDGKGLATYWDDASILLMDFLVPGTALSLEFGNDDPGWTVPGDVALLTLFNNAVQVAQTSVVLNRDDIMNQSIGIGGVLFDHATFVYANALLAPIGLIEVVDNIQYSPVPEPATLALLGVGLVGMLGARWRRRKQ